MMPGLINRNFRLLNKLLSIVLIIIFQIRFGVCSTDMCRQLPIPGILEETRGTFLEGNAYATFKVRTLVICAARCMRQRRCKSFNYDKDELKCGLNDATHVQKAIDMKACPTKRDIEYYDIRQWDENWLGPCRNHDCPSGTICVSVTGSKMISCDTNHSADIPIDPINTPNPTQSPDACTQYEGCANCTDPIGGSLKQAEGKAECALRHMSPYLETDLFIRNFSAIGCYRYGVLPTLLIDFRAHIVWGYASWFEGAILSCAFLALELNYELFGIENYGECYAGNRTEASFLNPISASACNTDCLYMDFGVGSGDVMFVYKFNDRSEYTG